MVRRAREGEDEEESLAVGTDYVQCLIIRRGIIARDPRRDSHPVNKSRTTPIQVVRSNAINKEEREYIALKKVDASLSRQGLAGQPSGKRGEDCTDGTKRED